ncbi:MAG: pyridoxal-phosphate dependent enzyme [Gemmatimonadota bacterium]|nr:pyridoxal-phosphate dependent enzyme [Gemmatimonadota bacterium]
MSLDRLQEARVRIENAIHRTPLLQSVTLTELVGAPVHLKCENLQKTGSFKVRGALHRLLQLSEEERARGVSTISAGNHAQAVAWAATAAGVPSLVVMPKHASPTKVRASRGYGAEVILHGDAAAAFVRVRELTAERGLTFVHPFDDEEVIAGHASCGLEIVEQLPDVGTIVVPVGGGGLSSGIAAAVAALGAEVDVWGVEPEGAPAMHRSLDEGRAVHLESVDTIADGLAAPMAGVLNHALLAAHAKGVVLVSDDEIVRAMKLLLERTKLLVEPAGAAGMAALLAGRVPFRPGRPVVVVLSGGNADLVRLASLFSERT